MYFPAAVLLEYTILPMYFKISFMNIFSNVCKELLEEVNKLKAELNQALSINAMLVVNNYELRDSSNAFSSQLDAALKVLSILKTYTPLFMIIFKRFIVSQLFVKNSRL